MNSTIYYVLGGLIAVYLFISMTKKKSSKERKSKKFMSDYSRKKKEQD